MQNTIVVLLMFIILSSCSKQQNETIMDTPVANSDLNSEFDQYLNKKISKNLTSLNLFPLEKSPKSTLRIWRFPGGGMPYEELYEFNLATKELKYQSYLTERFLSYDKKDLSHYNIKKEVRDIDLSVQLEQLINHPSIIDANHTGKNCVSTLSCGDLFFIECKQEKAVQAFTLDKGIRDCCSKEESILIRFIDIIENMIQKYGHYSQ